MDLPAGLAPVVEALDATGWAAQVTDPEWRLLWASKEMRIILAADEDDDLGIGELLIQPSRRPSLAVLAPSSADAWLRLHAPFVMHDTGATPEQLAARLDEEQRPVLAGLRPREAPARWAFTLEVERIGGVSCLGERVRSAEGALLGNAFIFGSALPASILAFVAAGDPAHFQRMAELVEPGRRTAAILFADVEGSTDRSRRLPSARYFDDVRRLNTAIDDAILRNGGIVGKHAGDGVSAFFLSDHLGSASAAARAAIDTGRAIDQAGACLEEGWRVNVGVHWGATLYMGQIATSGRLEVTALGDEVNECARIEEAAWGGQLLASKELLERLSSPDAAALGIDPAGVGYVLVRELPDVPEKSRRDAGSLPVTPLS
jgi:class 3 adenylate cyclase